MQLHVVSPLFTGTTEDETLILKRKDLWIDWLQSDGFQDLRQMCREQIAIYAYSPGTELVIPKKDDPNSIKVTFPQHRQARVPKGLVARCHLLMVLEQIDQRGDDPTNVVLACIDGSGAFDFDCLKLLVEAFNDNATVDVVLGRRPADYSGMETGRKEIEEFEQYLLLRHRPEQAGRAFSAYDLSNRILPDGQAGCWGFRLRAASRLPLTASGYELEFDLLASAVEASLIVAYTKPLLMPRIPRYSGASKNAVEMSIKKLTFIERKLGITRADTAAAWGEFASRFAGSPVMKNILPDYEPQLRASFE